MEDPKPDVATSRGRFLGAAAMVAATTALSTATASAQSYEEQIKGRVGPSISDPGPKSPLTRSFPDSYIPPPTDHGLPPEFWNSMNNQHRRIEPGGWTRQVNIDDFPISKEIAGVNMRLDSGGIRELHWHVADEWALMLTGNCRITALDYDGRPFVDDVKAGDLWYFPAGVPHSLQGTGEDGCEFLLVFDQGDFSEEDTTLITDWVVHTPREILAKNWGVSVGTVNNAVAGIPSAGRYIFPSQVPPALSQDRRTAAHGGALSPTNFSFRMMEMKPQKSEQGGEIRIVDSTIFLASRNIAVAHVTLKPGGMRELHWHPNADEWQYWVSGKGRMTVFFNHSTANTQDFQPGDIAYIPRTFGHYIENTGTEDLVFLEMFKTPVYQDFSLNDWMTHLPPELVEAHLDLSREVLDAIPDRDYGILPR